MHTFITMLNYWLFIDYIIFWPRTSYDRICIVNLDDMRGVAILMSKIFKMFSRPAFPWPCITGYEWFCCRSDSIVRDSYRKKLSFNNQNCHYLMIIGIITTPIYIVSMSHQMFYGYKLFNTPNSSFYSGPHELVVSIYIFLPIYHRYICIPILFFHYQFDKSLEKQCIIV